MQESDEFLLVDREQRLANERKCREYIKRIFASVMFGNWNATNSIWLEAANDGEWMAVAVWAGLPNTVKERLREMNSENQ